MHATSFRPALPIVSAVLSSNRLYHPLLTVYLYYVTRAQAFPFAVMGDEEYEEGGQLGIAKALDLRNSQVRSAQRTLLLLGLLTAPDDIFSDPRLTAPPAISDEVASVLLQLAEGRVRLLDDGPYDQQTGKYLDLRGS